MMAPTSLSYPRIVFMGTPEFAVASLEALVLAGYPVVAVVTAPDKPAGRGLKLTESAVKKYAVAQGIPVLQPVKLKDPEFLLELQQYNAHLQVVVAFRMLPEVVWSMPPMGTINVHGSLLPQYRGAAPINWAIIHGNATTGVTTFKLQHEIDTGNILLQSSFAIGENDTCGQVHDHMKQVGASLLVQTIAGLIDGSLTETPQSQLPSSNLQHAPKIFTDTCRIQWQQSCAQIHNLIRGLSPFPAAFTQLHGKILKIYLGQKILAAHTYLPGEVVSDQKTYLHFACTDGFISATEVQLEGKKRMAVADFLRGYVWP